MALLVDTCVLVSAADRDEPRHSACAELLAAHHGELITTAPVVPETAWLLEARLGTPAEVRFLRLITGGELQVVDLAPAYYERCVELIETYADLGFVDASLVVVAETRRITTIATLNHRDFRVVRPRHVDAFTLLP
ncbi:MAG: type II toxin-antitoxin system VapC family toxin [Mycobacteriales bacterium]